MSTAPEHRLIDVDEFLLGEQQARIKHEYVEGLVYAMIGATNAHNRIATNAIGILHSQLRGKRCQVFNSDTKVRIQRESGTRFYYPDAMVVCQPNSAEDTYQDRPVVIIEVLSDSTRRIDRLEKRPAYWTIDSLAVYLMIEPDRPEVLVDRRKPKDRRGPDGFDTSIVEGLEIVEGLDGVIELTEIDCRLPLAELYAEVRFPTEEELREREEAYFAS